MTIGWKIFCDGDFGLTESPIWDYCRNGLWWVDIPQQKVYFKRFTSVAQCYDIDDDPGSLFLLNNGNILVAGRLGIWQLNVNEGSWKFLADSPFNSEKIRFNDNCQYQSIYIAGSLIDKKDQANAAVYQIFSDGQTKQLFCGLTTVNGLGFDNDKEHLIIADTFSRTIRKFKYCKEGSLSNEQIIWQKPDSLERPDGLWIDNTNHLYFAMFEGAKIMVLTLDGQWVKNINLPVFCPTKITTGGQNNEYIFITSAGNVRGERELNNYPMSGKIIYCSTAKLVETLN